MTNPEAEPPIPAQEQQMQNPEQQATVNIDQFLENPDQLRALLESDAPEQAEMQQKALIEIVAPEGLAEASKTIAGQVAEQGMHGAGLADRYLTVVGDELQEATRRFGAVDDDVYQARRSLGMIRDFLDSGNPQDIDVARAATTRLQEFHENYGRSQRHLADSYEESAGQLRGARSGLDETAEAANHGFREIGKLEQRADDSPEDMAFEGVEQKVTERGATTAEEHKDQCEIEVTRADQFVGTVFNNAQYAAEEISSAATRLLRSRDVLDDMPNANRIGDMVHEMSSAIYRMAEYGPQMRGIAEEAWGNLYRAVTQVEQGVGEVKQLGNSNAQVLEQARQEVQQLKRNLETYPR